MENREHVDESGFLAPGGDDRTTIRENAVAVGDCLNRNAGAMVASSAELTESDPLTSQILRELSVVRRTQLSELMDTFSLPRSPEWKEQSDHSGVTQPVRNAIDAVMGGPSDGTLRATVRDHREMIDAYRTLLAGLAGDHPARATMVRQLKNIQAQAQTLEQHREQQ